MTDWVGRPDADRKLAFLSRGVAALCIKRLAGVTAEVAAAALTDGFQDNYLDAVHFDQPNDTLYLVQSKWSQDGNKSIDAAAAGGLAAGTRDLLNARFEKFNAKVKSKEAEIRAALYSERHITFHLVTAHTGTQQIAPFVRSKIDDLLAELNDTAVISEATHLDQGGIYSLITSETKPLDIKLQISLNDYGQIEKPFLAYYGRVHINEIVEWWKSHGNSLFTQNLRLFYPNSEVNEALGNTLSISPASFWYFNNGITVVCDSVVKAAIGAPARVVGLFTCNGASIVNGAQTVGTIGRAGAVGIVDDDGGDREAWVQVRIISLEKCPPEFGQEITRAANLQNAVGNREFAAMDGVQQRLATEFALDKRRYVYKQGEADPKGGEGCDIVEATQALACARSVSMAVSVKREISALWADTRRAPYTDIFNENLTGLAVWRSVLVMRAVDDVLQKRRWTETPKADMIGVHLNRIILHLVFSDYRVRALRHDEADEGALISAAKTSTDEVFIWVSGYISANHDGEYLASLCKNLSKCEALANAFLRPEAAQAGTSQADLFS